MATHIVFDVEADALSFQEQVSSAFGYPKVGVDVGAGRHVKSITTRYADLIKHPTLNEWAHPCPAEVLALLPTIRDAAPALKIADPVALDASWLPPIAAPLSK